MSTKGTNGGDRRSGCPSISHAQSCFQLNPPPASLSHVFLRPILSSHKAAWCLHLPGYLTAPSGENWTAHPERCRGNPASLGLSDSRPVDE
ncbi:hypothetical protein DPEC_G00183440 [Dallia pectoralis]|uniref:Uncharacterized protein n=1 Tax=Dallia pectoralis TaxID=75939 RepID=A0ACC2GAS1_DALPE|nr:hypothetical protein DPEC_G00183440 [Dallia pectoralis]